MFNFTAQFIATADGSPTVRLGDPKDGENLSEAMHSLKGAFSETVYIYGTAIELCLEKGFQPPRVLSIGLGIGYVEILAVALALARGALRENANGEILGDFSGESFEIVPELRDYFHIWATNEGEVPDPFFQAYTEVLQRTATQTGVEAALIRKTLGSLLDDGRWLIRGALESETQFSKKASCICFDAFSSKSTPDLWTEEFLDDLFRRVCAEGCVLSTYACTGKLKRSLRKAGFDLNIREGFSSKRDSTFAVRQPIS